MMTMNAHVVCVLDEDYKMWKNYRVLLGKDRMMGVRTGRGYFPKKWFILYEDIEHIRLGKGNKTLVMDKLAW